MPQASTRTLVTFPLDRTGSMEAIRDDTIGGFNAYLDGLKGNGEAEIEFTLIQSAARLDAPDRRRGQDHQRGRSIVAA